MKGEDAGLQWVGGGHGLFVEQSSAVDFWRGLLSTCPCPSLPTGVGSSSMPLWDFQGSTMLTSQYVRLTPDERSKEGSIWNHQVSLSQEAKLSRSRMQ